MISVKGLYKNYSDFEALKNINLNIPKGSVYGLIGSNGAGKTTLLKIITGVFKADAGTVKLDGQDIYENVDAKMKMFVTDNPYYYPTYTIKDMARFYKGIYKTWDEEKYQKLKDIFKLDENKKIRNMSKGMQRQALIWLALSVNTEILILDEPLDGLDALMRQKVKKLIFQEVIDRNLTVLISSHNLRELEDFCDHIAIIHKGKVVLEKDIDDLRDNIFKVQVAFKDSIPQKLLDSINILKISQNGRVCNWIIKGDKNKVEEEINKYNPVLVDTIPLTLEEIFICEMEGIGYEKENIII